MPDLTVFHTNDMHGRLTGRGAEIIASEKSSCERCLLVDCGDAVSSGNIYYHPRGESMLARMSDLGYDAMAMGNREFSFSVLGTEIQAQPRAISDTLRKLAKSGFGGRTTDPVEHRDRRGRSESGSIRTYSADDKQKDAGEQVQPILVRGPADRCIGTGSEN